MDNNDVDSDPGREVLLSLLQTIKKEGVDLDEVYKQQEGFLDGDFEYVENVEKLSELGKF